MKKVFIILMLLSPVYVQSVHAKGLLDYIDKGFRIAGNVALAYRALNGLAESSRRNEPVTRVIYKNKVVYREAEKPSGSELELKTSLANSQRKLAWEKAKDKKHETALKLYEKSLENDANSWMVWHGYGWSFSELKRYDEARNAFLMAIKLGAKDETWRYLGWNYARQGYNKEAVRCYAEAIKINPDNEQAYIGLKASKKKLKKNRASSKSAEKWLKVTASPSLTVRSRPSVKGKKIGSLEKGSLVKLIKYIGKKQSIGGKRARWAKIEYNNKVAYAFSAHLVRY